MILRKASRVFNEYGYAGTSMAQLLKATGLEKGGLYNHFASKEDLAVEAFDYSVHRVNERFSGLLASETTARGRLLAIITGFEGYYENPPVPGGCPITNTAIEADNANPRLRARARAAMNDFLGAITAIIKGGIKRGELRASIDPQEAATVMLTSFEGALMLSNLHSNPVYLNKTTAFLRRYVEEMAA